MSLEYIYFDNYSLKNQNQTAQQLPFSDMYTLSKTEWVFQWQIATWLISSPSDSLHCEPPPPSDFARRTLRVINPFLVAQFSKF